VQKPTFSHYQPHYGVTEKYPGRLAAKMFWLQKIFREYFWNASNQFNTIFILLVILCAVIIQGHYLFFGNTQRNKLKI